MKKLKLSDCTVLESSNTLFCDVDETLILWDIDNSVSGVTIEDPHLPNHSRRFKPHVTHINILKRNFSQGRTIIVWSAAGHEWATAVVKALNLEKYVSLILGKPTIYMDDLPMDKWKPQRIYLKRDIEGEDNE